MKPVNMTEKEATEFIFKLIAERWSNRDMEAFFKERADEYISELRKELKDKLKK